MMLYLLPGATCDNSLLTFEAEFGECRKCRHTFINNLKIITKSIEKKEKKRKKKQVNVYIFLKQKLNDSFSIPFSSSFNQTKKTIAYQKFL